MTDPASPKPDSVPATGDPGDETASRYRYQWMYAAIVCCALLDDTANVVEVFCEHHEDILTKDRDGAFSGLQVKTRDSNQPVWRTREDAVKRACARFATLEAEFPGRFKAYRFLTNHPLHAANNGQDLRYVLRMIREATSLSELPGSVRSFVEAVANQGECDEEVVLRALSKADADDNLPRLADVKMRLVNALTAVWSRAEDCTFASVLRAARHLVWECEQASSLAHRDVLPAYLPVTTDPAAAELASRLSRKRIEVKRLLEILENGLYETAELEGEPDALPEPRTGATTLLLEKLDAGGFSAVSRNSAEDLRDKADYLGIVWTKKYGRSRGLQRYGHIRSLVLMDAAQAYEMTKADDHPFGLDMLAELRSLFRQRRSEGARLYDCSDEHLEGFAYVLTSECHVLWSRSSPRESA